jgi:hypothetical protein
MQKMLQCGNVLAWQLMYQRDNSSEAGRSSQGNPATHVDAPQVRVTVSRHCSTTWRKPMQKTYFAQSLPKQGLVIRGVQIWCCLAYGRNVRAAR